jgi:CubicO group peptidase (beta-lactamase class C family)
LFPDQAELLDIASREGNIRQPEATFKYTNIGYSLLGMIVGKAAGGMIVSLFAGGMKAWPIEDYRAMSSVLQSASLPV